MSERSKIRASIRRAKSFTSLDDESASRIFRLVYMPPTREAIYRIKVMSQSDYVAQLPNGIAKRSTFIRSDPGMGGLFWSALENGEVEALFFEILEEWPTPYRVQSSPRYGILPVNGWGYMLHAYEDGPLPKVTPAKDASPPRLAKKKVKTKRIYLITNPLFTEPIGKIGISCDPIQRAKELSSAGYPRAFIVEGMSASLSIPEARRLEGDLHRHFIQSNHVEGGGREWFRLNAEILNALEMVDGWTWRVS